jgi:regulator of protease activity HflC (stomatin/prohibitin superfamily)
MKSITKLIVGLLVILLLAMISLGLLAERIPPAVIGVKQNQLAGGIVEKDFATGYHLGIAGVHKWYRLDGRVHFATFSRESEGRGRSDSNTDYASSLEIRTSDNNTASLDVTVTYRIQPGSAWKLVQSGLHLQYRDRVRDAIAGLLREELSKLSPEDFVSTEVRLQRVQETMPLVREQLAQYYVEPLSLLIRAVRFPPEYEEKLQLKQLTRQLSELAKAREKQERQGQITDSYEKETEAREKRLRGEWDVKLQEERSANEVTIAQILADAQIYDQTTRANAEANFVSSIATGELEVARAEALRDELRNAALDSKGGRILLAKQAAENLDIRDVTLNSNDPSVPTVLDLSEMVKLLIGDE